MIRVGYIGNEPSPSRAPHLDRIAEHPELELTVVYAGATVQRREWTLELNHDPVILSGPSLPLTRILHHDYPLTPQIWRLLERERFDVLVISGWSLLATQLAIVWARLHHVPYLLVAENHLLEPRPRWVRALKSAVLRYVIPQAAAQLVPGSLAAEHARHYGARPDTITIFPQTIDVPAYAAAAARLRPRRVELRRTLGVPEEAVVVLQVGRLLPVKGVIGTVEAVALARRQSGAPLHLLLVGDGELRPVLEQRAAELGVPVTFTGFRQAEALLECYAAADVFALLSERETWGVVVNEAAAFGLPLVLTDTIGAAADLLRPGENGELVAAGDVEAAAGAFVRLLDPELRREYGRRSSVLVEPWGYDQSIDSFAAAARAAIVRSRTGTPEDPRKMTR